MPPSYNNPDTSLHRLVPKSQPICPSNITQNCLNTLNSCRKNSREIRPITPCKDSIKIKKINQIVNICRRREINLNISEIDSLRKDQSVSQNRSKKQKINVSLSRERDNKKEGLTQRSTNKSTKINISLNKREDSIRKIKNFDITKQEDDLKKITPRIINDLNKKEEVSQVFNKIHIQNRQNKQNNSLLNCNQPQVPQKKKIRISKNK